MHTHTHSPHFTAALARELFGKDSGTLQKVLAKASLIRLLKLCQFYHLSSSVLENVKSFQLLQFKDFQQEWIWEGGGLLGWQAGGPKGRQAAAETEADRLGQKGWVLATKTACNSWLTLRTKLVLHWPAGSQTQWSLAKVCWPRSIEWQTANIWDTLTKGLVERKVPRQQSSVKVPSAAGSFPS